MDLGADIALLAAALSLQTWPWNPYLETSRQSKFARCLPVISHMLFLAPSAPASADPGGVCAAYALLAGMSLTGLSMPIAECDAGHELNRWRNRCSTLRCDGGCGKGLEMREWRWSCTICDFDVCPSCYEDRVARMTMPCRPPRASAAEAAAANAGPAAGGDVPENASASVKPRGTSARVHVGLTPTTTEAPSCELWVYAPQSLASVKRDLTTFGSGVVQQHNKHPCTRPSRLGLQESTSVTATSSPSAPTLPHELPDLTALGLPATTLVRMHAARDWLHQLTELELARARRVADGELSAFERACGMERAMPISAKATDESVEAVRARFAAECHALRARERMEIEAMQAMGECRSAEHIVYA